MLVPLPLEKQIQDLLASHRVEEALVLAKGARRNIPKEKFQVCNSPVTRKAASECPGEKTPTCQQAVSALPSSTPCTQQL